MAIWAKDNHENVFKKKKILQYRIKGIQKAIDHDLRKPYLLDLEDRLNDELEIILDQEENFWALFSIRGMKPPQKDGIHVIFYQNFWDIISEDCVAPIQKIFQTRKIMRDLNKTIVALIPKS